MFQDDNNNGQKVNGHNEVASLIGHNGGEPISLDEALASFDDIVRDVLSSGLVLTQRDALIRCIRDPRLSRQHQIVLVEVIEHTNKATGMAYPGRRLISQRTGYTEAGISKALSELRAFGYIVDTRRAGPNGGRALMHYAITKPTVEQLQEAIAAHVASLRAPKQQADVTPGGKVADFTPVGKLRSGFTPVGKLRGLCSGADFTPVVPTVTRREEKEVSEVSIGAVAPTRVNEDLFSDEVQAHQQPDASPEIEILEPEIVGPGEEFGNAKPKAAKRSKESKAVPFGEDWQLTGRWLKVAHKYGLSDADAESEFQNCRLHYLGTGKKATAWVFLWEAWCKRAASSPKRSGRSSNGWVDAMRATRAAPIVDDEPLL